MLLSELLKIHPDTDVISIINENNFDRFSRTTSNSDGAICVYVASPQYIKTIPDNATMVIVAEDIYNELNNEKYGVCISKKPKATYFRAFVAAATSIKSEAKPTIIGNNCEISNFVSISKTNVTIGNNVKIEDFVTIYDNVVIGDNCVIRSGARIGVQDYNFFEDEDKLVHLPHYGALIIMDDVEIGFNTVVGKSLYPGDTTVIGKGTKIANGCGIGHDCKIGENVMIYAGTMLAGFVEIGDNTHITLNATIKNAIKIGSNVQVDMGSVVLRSVSDGEKVFGNPARRVVSPK